MTPHPKSPPVPGPARNVEFPEAETWQLSNGLSLVVLPDDRLPQVSVRLGLRRGRVHDPAENTALLSVSTEMLPLGAGGRSAQQIAETLDHYAIHFESDVGLESSYLAWDALTPNLAPSFELMSSLLLEPDFPEEELERLKVRWKSGLLQLRSQPAFLASERCRLSLYPEHPLNRIGIRPEDLDTIIASQLRTTHLTHFAPSSSLLLCCGDIHLSEAIALAERTLNRWTNSPSPPPPALPIPDFRPERVDLVHRPGSVQTRLLITGKAPSRSSPDLTAVKLANQVFGGSASSRLFLNLREEKGLTYGAYSRLTTFNEDGLFQASADVRSESVAIAIRETISEIEGIYSRPPDSGELERARSEMIGNFIQQMETSSGVGALELNRRLYNLRENYYKNYIPDLLAVSRASMLDHAHRYLRGDQVLVTVVGDADLIRRDLEGTGRLYIWDNLGKLLEEPD